MNERRKRVAELFPLALLGSAWCFGLLLFFYFKDHYPLIGVLSLPFGIMLVIGLLVSETEIKK